jgi:hypothetical protein
MIPNGNVVRHNDVMFFLTTVVHKFIFINDVNCAVAIGKNQEWAESWKYQLCWCSCNCGNCRDTHLDLGGSFNRTY